VRNRRAPRRTSAGPPIPQRRNAPPRQTQPAAHRTFSRTLTSPRQPQSAGYAPPPGPALPRTQTAADPTLPQAPNARSLVFLRTQAPGDSPLPRTQTAADPTLPQAPNAGSLVLLRTQVPGDPPLPRN
jgi:hypothetical protein